MEVEPERQGGELPDRGAHDHREGQADVLGEGHLITPGFREIQFVSAASVVAPWPILSSFAV